jgi:hypothetical protein
VWASLHTEKRRYLIIKNKKMAEHDFSGVKAQLYEHAAKTFRNARNRGYFEANGDWITYGAKAVVDEIWRVLETAANLQEAEENKAQKNESADKPAEAKTAA